VDRVDLRSIIIGIGLFLGLGMLLRDYHNGSDYGCDGRVGLERL
jgi:hypothetical protein